MKTQYISLKLVASVIIAGSNYGAMSNGFMARIK
jgi:hypothetical protein